MQTMMDQGCRAYRAAFLLGELLAGPLAHHEAACALCLRFRQAEQDVGDALRTVAPRFVAPASLRDKIAAALEAERARAGAPGLRRRFVWLGVAVALAAAVPLIVSRVSGDAGPDRARATSLLVVEDYLQFAHAGSEKLQIAAVDDDAANVEAFFRERLAFEAKLPRLSGAHLLGGRRCSLAGRPAALAFYERPIETGLTEPVLLFVFQPAGEDWSGMRRVPGLVKRRACVNQARGVGLLVWEERGLVYVLAGNRDGEELATLLPSL